jgi:hypothetical protein
MAHNFYVLFAFAVLSSYYTNSTSKKNFMKKTITISALALLAFASKAQQYYQQSPKLTASGLQAEPSFGWAISLSSDATTAIAGAPGHTSGDVGAAVIYNRSGSAWTQGQVLVGTGAVLGANQGQSVAISADGNTAIVGGPDDNSEAGAAWVYVRSGNTWAQQGNKLVGSDATGAAAQGYSVSISGDGNTVIVGGPEDNSGMGAAWVYARTGGTWAQVGAKLVGSGASSTTGYTVQQGFAVALSTDGNTALICGDNDNYGDGAVWTFTHSGSTWAQQGNKLSLTGVTFPDFGTSAALSADGNTAVVGAAAESNDAGAAYVLYRSNSTWALQGTLIGTLPVGSAQQGGAVAISAGGDTAVVGGAASVFTTGASNIGTGAAWVFTRSGSTWTQAGNKFTGTGAAGNSQQGSGVAISGNGSTFVVGGFGDNDYTGALWVYSNDIPVTTAVPSVTVNDQVKVFPNPATDELSIDFKTALKETAVITIIDQTGRIVSTHIVNGNATFYTEKVSSLSPGIYVLSISAQGNEPQKYMFVKN